MRYADPSLCPDCRSALPEEVPVCPSCSLLVRHPLAVDLFGTLRRADELVTDLRAASDRFHGRPVATAASAEGAIRATSLGGPMKATLPAAKRATGTTSGAATLVPPGPVTGATPRPPITDDVPAPPHGPLPPYPTAPGPSAPGLDFSSVPKILLGLGAFCLLVAALIFLAVSWSTLGVGGRTAILGAFTVSAGAAALGLHRAGLRIAGESLSVVALGMLTLDVFGAGAAGWFGTLSDAGLTAVAGIVLVGAATAAGLLRVAGQPRLVAPQVIVGVALLMIHGGAADAFPQHPLLLAHAVCVLAALLATVGLRESCPVLAWSPALAGALVWLGGASLATSQAIDDPTLRQLWIDGSGWSLIASAALLLVPGAVLRHRVLLLGGASSAAMVLTIVATLPCADTDAGTVGLVTLLVTGAWVTALALLPTEARIIAIAPAALGSLILLGLSLVTAGVAIARWLGTGDAFAARAGVALSSPSPVTEPLLLVPSLIVIVCFLALLAPGVLRATLPTWLVVGGVTIGLGVATTLASYDVALALPLAVLVLVALGGAALAVRDSALASPGAAIAVVVGGLASIGALPSSVLTAVAASVASILVVTVAVAARTRTGRIVAGVATAPLLTLAVSALTYELSADAAWIAIPVLLAVSVLALALPRLEVEVPAIVLALLTLPVSLDEATEPTAYAALWLAVAGFACCATSLIHETRREAMWPGAGLLLLASWVRLADLQVHAPEAYTLPLAAALLAFGVWRMRTDDTADSMASLLPGLLLGTVPSLLWVLADPVSLRALVLGGACLVVTIAGAWLRWSALLVVGASVGAIIVLREIGPYSGDFPKWVWIGLAGLLLTTVGITWERRLLEVRRAIGFLGRLR